MQNLNANLPELTTELDRIVSKYNAPDTEKSVRRLVQEASELGSSALRVVVAGEFSSGKSTLLNTLMGRDLLPTDLDESTKTTFRVIASDSEEEYLVVDGGKRKMDEIESINLTERRVVDLHYIGSSLSKQIVFYDTPGLSGMDKEQAEITANALAEADLVMLVVNGRQGLVDSLDSFLKSKDLVAAKWLLVLTYGDTLNENEIKKSLEHHSGMGFDRVMFTSPSGEPGTAELLSYLKETIVPQTIQLKQKALQRRILDATTSVTGILDGLLDSLELNTDEIQARITENTDEMIRIKQQIQDERAKTRTRLNEKVRSLIRQFAEEAEEVAKENVDEIFERGTGKFQRGIQDIWESKMFSFQAEVRESLDDFSASINSIASSVDVKIPAYVKWVDIGMTLLSAVLLPAPGVGNLIEGFLGHILGKDLGRKLAQNAVKGALLATVQQIVRTQESEMRDVISKLDDDIKERIEGKYQARMEEINGVLNDLREEKKSKRLDVETKRSQLKTDTEKVHSIGRAVS